MAASKDSKFRGKRARQFREAQRTSFKRDRENDAPRNPNLAPRYSVLYTGRRSSVDADELAARLKAREREVRNNDD